MLEILWLIIRIVVLAIGIFAVYLEVTDPIITDLFKADKDKKENSIRKRGA